MCKRRAICSHPEDYSSSDDSFCLQIKVQQTQASLKKILTPTHQLLILHTDCNPIIPEINTLEKDWTLAWM